MSPVQSGPLQCPLPLLLCCTCLSASSPRLLCNLRLVLRSFRGSSRLLLPPGLQQVRSGESPSAPWAQARAPWLALLPNVVPSSSARSLCVADFRTHSPNNADLLSFPSLHSKHASQMASNSQKQTQVQLTETNSDKQSLLDKSVCVRNHKF